MDRDAFINAIIRELEVQKQNGDESIAAPPWQGYGSSERRVKLSPTEALRKVSDKFQFDFPLVDDNDLLQASEAITNIDDSPIAGSLYISPKFIENLDYVANKGVSKAAAVFVKTAFCCLSNELLRCPKQDLCLYFFGGTEGSAGSIDATWSELFGHFLGFLLTSRSVLACLQQQKDTAESSSGVPKVVSNLISINGADVLNLVEVLRMLRNALTAPSSTPAATNIRTLESFIRIHPSHLSASAATQRLVTIDELHEIKESVLRSFFHISYLVRDLLVAQPGLVPECLPSLFDVLYRFDEGVSKSMDSEDESLKDSIHSLFILVFGHLIEGLLGHKTKLHRSKFGNSEPVDELHIVLDWLSSFIEEKLPDFVSIFRNILEECIASETNAASAEEAPNALSSSTPGKLYQLSSIVSNITELLLDQALAKNNSLERLIPHLMSSVIFDIISFQCESFGSADVRLSRVVSRLCLNDRPSAPISSELLTRGLFKALLSNDTALIADAKSPPNSDPSPEAVEFHRAFKLFGAHAIGIIIGAAATASARLSAGLLAPADDSTTSLPRCLNDVLFGTGEAAGACVLRRQLLEARVSAGFARCLAPAFSDLMTDLAPPPQSHRGRGATDEYLNTKSWSVALFCKCDDIGGGGSFRKQISDLIARWIENLNSISSQSIPLPNAPLQLSDAVMPVEPPGQGKPRSTSWDWSEEEEDEVDKQVAEDIKDISNETLIEAASNEALIIPAEVEGRAVLMEALSMVTEASSSGAGSGSHQLHHGKENVESKTIVSSIDYHKIKYAIKSLKLLIDSTKMGAQSVS